ncbi:hypothetical protein Mapa_001829 [Marchantia paleacea]|nr:hypothetical protein Mapa_001829 [Marchantia paleacea]
MNACEIRCMISKYGAGWSPLELTKVGRSERCHRGRELDVRARSGVVELQFASYMRCKVGCFDSSLKAV